MTEEELIAIVASVSRHLTAENRALAARFVAVLATHDGSIELADDDRARRDAERAWETEQLSGQDLARREREPA